MSSTRPSRQVMTVIAVLLTFVSGAADVASFTRLGNVFASVMTGNIVLFGLALAHDSVSLASHTAVAFAGYVVGVAVGTQVAWFHASLTGAAAPAKNGESVWPPHITMALLLEFLLIAGVAVGWEISGSNPGGAPQFLMLAGISCAMGIQASAVLDMGLKEVSTTYLTGTLTGLVGALASRRRQAGLRRPGVLIGLVSGAVLAGVFVAYIPDLVPALPLAGVAGVIVLGSGLVEDPRSPVPVPRKPG